MRKPSLSFFFCALLHGSLAFDQWQQQMIHSGTKGFGKGISGIIFPTMYGGGTLKVEVGLGGITGHRLSYDIFLNRDEFAFSVASSTIVGAPAATNDSAVRTGAAILVGSYSKERITPSNGQCCGGGTSCSMRFGHSMATLNGYLFIGAPFDGCNGAVHVYKYLTGTGWYFFTRLDGTDYVPANERNASFGIGMSAGNLLAVQASFPSQDKGKIYLFDVSGTSIPSPTVFSPGSVETGFAQSAFHMSNDMLVVASARNLYLYRTLSSSPVTISPPHFPVASISIDQDKKLAYGVPGFDQGKGMVYMEDINATHVANRTNIAGLAKGSYFGAGVMIHYDYRNQGILYVGSPGLGMVTVYLDIAPYSSALPTPSASLTPKNYPSPTMWPSPSSVLGLPTPTSTSTKTLSASPRPVNPTPTSTSTKTLSASPRPVNPTPTSTSTKTLSASPRPVNPTPTSTSTKTLSASPRPVNPTPTSTSTKTLSASPRPVNPTPTSTSTKTLSASPRPNGDADQVEFLATYGATTVRFNVSVTNGGASVTRVVQGMSVWVPYGCDATYPDYTGRMALIGMISDVECAYKLAKQASAKGAAVVLFFHNANQGPLDFAGTSPLSMPVLSIAYRGPLRETETLVAAYVQQNHANVQWELFPGRAPPTSPFPSPIGSPMNVTLIVDVTSSTPPVKETWSALLATYLGIPASQVNVFAILNEDKDTNYELYAHIAYFEYQKQSVDNFAKNRLDAPLLGALSLDGVNGVRPDDGKGDPSTPKEENGSNGLFGISMTFVIAGASVLVLLIVAGCIVIRRKRKARYRGFDDMELEHKSTGDFEPDPFAGDGYRGGVPTPMPNHHW